MFLTLLPMLETLVTVGGPGAWLPLGPAPVEDPAQLLTLQVEG